MLELGGAKPATVNPVIDGSDATFMADVIDASREAPVVVQFTAEWCGPCKTLGPQLEKAVAAKGGAVKMVRMDIDKNPMVAQQMRIQSIPAVFAFADGQPVDGFMGAQPESEIKKFVEKIAVSSGPGAEQADQVAGALAAAEAALGEGATGEAAQIFSQVLQVEPENVAALAGLARCYAANGETGRAGEILDMAPADKQTAPEIVQARALIDLTGDAGDSGELATLSAKVDAAPDDHQARYDYAMALVGASRHEDAIEQLLDLFRRDREWNDGAARTQLFKVFEALGGEDPVALKGRRKLSSMIFA